MNERFGNSEQLARADAAGGLNEQSGNSGQLQGAADELLLLVSQWRADADTNELHALEADSIGIPQATHTHEIRMKMLRQHADQLEAALAARQPVGQDRMAIKLLVAAGFVTEEKANESLRIAHGFGGDLGQPAPAAVPVDVLEALAETWEERAGHNDERALKADSIGDRLAIAAHTARSTELRQSAHALRCAALATHPQPAAAKEQGNG
ncbi:hypothetical protein [Xanthomonas phaseoli]|uniref:hypothetical protein n=1 Tax=Xanthomonas phaseoli TaxID=1985254 RepID=UPI0003785A8A|nr:hypothetical protein [Xanthomonas phaseoli]RWU16209.1 hypothetical protein XANMN_12810 [Xanthomonas phaseoli pv. manihotis str. CIO151]UEQ13680.1 hypothetical protein K9838_13170 [Xanthomonas phaseoli pv. manihotis]